MTSRSAPIKGAIRYDFEIQLSFHRSGSNILLRNKCLCAGKSWHPRAEGRVCALDAFRLCAGYIPDPTRVEHCLRQNISDACRLVFEQSAGLVASRVK
jgi:hypothetical protein